MDGSEKKSETENINITGSVDHSAEIYELLIEQKKLLWRNICLSRENLWTQIFNSTITGSSWLTDQSFSFGRWAIGYPFAYALYRTLNEVHPKSVLELGLGQSTKITAQYVRANPETLHIVFESDEEWLAFFRKGFDLPVETKVQICPYEFENFKEAENVRVFSGFHEVIEEKKFELILIDAPFGGDMKIISRIDVLKEIPGILADSFVIIIDDYDRRQEKRLVSEITAALKENNIEYCEGIYRGEKETCVICSPDNKFIKSM